MGQGKNQLNYRDGDGSSGTYLSPSAGTISSPIRFLPYAIGIFGLAFFASCFTASIMTPVQNSDALQQVALSLDDSGYYANVSSSGLVNLDLIATIDGATAIAHDTVTTTTNSATGYKLYISSDSTSANSNRLNKDGSTSASYYLSTINGTPAAPATLADNSWGYTLTTTTGNNGNVTGSSNFIGMPLLYNENLLHSYGSPATSGNSIEIYYGVKATTALPSGAYTSNVVYTVVAEGAPATAGEVTIFPVEIANSKAGGETLTITTGLYTSSDQVGNATVTIGGRACTNVTPTVTSTGAIRLTCTTPAMDNWGSYDVVVNIPKYEKTYTKTNGYTYYVPWEDMTEMQEMTAYACNKVATPSAFTNGDTAPKYAYGNYNGTPVTEAMVQASPSTYWTSSVVDDARITNINTNVPETTLTDNRDGEEYVVRKLADGNCWMTENLRLTWESGDEIETANGDIWIPYHTTETSSNHTIWRDTNSEIEDAIISMGITSDDIKNQFRASYYDHSYNNTDTIVNPNGDSQEAGSYYNWRAATAGTTRWGNTDATDSICPRGWQLPTESNKQPIDKSWVLLLWSTYGLYDFDAGDNRITRISANDATPRSYHAYAFTEAMTSNPLSFAGAGFYQYKTGTVGGIDHGAGYWWTSKAQFSGATWETYLYGKGNHNIEGNSTGFGFSIRCVNQ